MKCHDAQTSLSLYLYGELDFAQEEALEQHLAGCAACQLALDREKAWHTTLNSGRTDVPFELLSACRRDLRTAVSAAAPAKPRSAFLKGPWFDRLNGLGFSATRWSMRVAVASLLVVIGFSAARWMDQNGLPGFSAGEPSHMGLIDPSNARIRDIQAGGNGRVRIVFDQVRSREVSGRVEDEDVRRLLLAATRDPGDPGIRVDSVEILKTQNGADVRDALLYSLERDPNAAVRLKALEGLRRFAGDRATRDALRFVLQHDDNPGVRSEAIDVLAPANQRVELSPDLARTLEEIARSQREDDYVRVRSLEILQKTNASLRVY
ncbi:MAG: HEAT repeat domain-containing protein [Acidobacteriaceae bacterium]|nr:HEAT repeat domain-containing protein [Acidobacteriaceae bacterium]